MAKGSKAISVRLGQGILDRIDAEIQRRNEQPGVDETWSRTDWIIHAIVQKINHSERSRKARTRTRVVREDELLPYSVFDDPYWQGIEPLPGFEQFDEKCQELLDILKERLENTEV